MLVPARHYPLTPEELYDRATGECRCIERQLQLTTGAGFFISKNWLVT